VLFFIVAWNEPLLWRVWREYHALFIFGICTVALYWMHFLLTFSREWRKKAKDDYYPGTSHVRRLARRFRFPAISDETLYFWVEPGAVLFVAAALRFAGGELHLSAWLFFVAFCMVGREAINYWTGVRRGKILAEAMRKTEENCDAFSDDQTDATPPKPTRTEPKTLKRNTAHAEEAAREERFAKLLRLRAPYMLEKAEENYKTLVQMEHPDGHENSPESNAATAELNEALEFFRDRLGG
jgi:hypothetical protein